MNTIRSRLLPYALGAGNDFVTVESYTYQALERMSAILDIDSVSDAKLIQFYALYCIYEATNGKSNWVTEADPRFDSLPTIPGWLVSNGWDNRVSNSVAALDPCTTSWYGITCDSSSRIIKIELASNLLIGQFPAEIILLGSDGAYGTGAGNLNRLDLFGNEFLVNYDDNTAAAAVPEPNWWWKHLGSNFGT